MNKHTDMHSSPTHTYKHTHTHSPSLTNIDDDLRAHGCRLHHHTANLEVWAEVDVVGPLEPQRYVSIAWESDDGLHHGYGHQVLHEGQVLAQLG